jgi:thioredoxin reductase (NADPH)
MGITRIPAHALDALDPSDPYARGAQTFPKLADDLVARMLPYGQEELIAAGTLLYRRGDRGNDFFLVRRGMIEIFDTDAHGESEIFKAYGPRQFTGELNLFNDRQILVSARARGDTKVLRIKRADFRRMVVAEPDVGEIIMRAYILRRVGLIQHTHGAVTVIGSVHDGDTLRIQRFLVRNAYPYRLLDIDADGEAAGFLEYFGLRPDQLPVLIVNSDEVVLNPPLGVLADKLGLTETIDPEKVHDVAVVGAGPAGLAAAVYAASEGLETIVIEAVAPGGQAGTSSKIENYLGFPTGISGQALAGRAQVQAQKFGARLAISREAVGLNCDSEPYEVELEGGRFVRARAIVIATGARYRKLDVSNYERFEGQGIHYAATAMEAQLCANEEVIVVGGGNSAGQAAVFLSRTCSQVHILVRADGLAATMSDYLIQRIVSSPRITLHPRTEINALHGDIGLQEVEWTEQLTGARERRRTRNIFVMIGAEPNTSWLGQCLDLDPKGFIITGSNGEGHSIPSSYATSRPGIFAVGDVRSGSIKRVASSVGEGSVVVSAIHRFLQPV